MTFILLLISVGVVFGNCSDNKLFCDQLNPTKMESPDDACANAEFLLQILDEVTLSIFMSAEACPK
jgi:Ras GTPase-activating protein 1